MPKRKNWKIGKAARASKNTKPAKPAPADESNQPTSGAAPASPAPTRAGSKRKASPSPAADTKKGSTASPSQAPTASPSQAPTASPSPAPTASPSPASTSSPSPAQTASPSPASTARPRRASTARHSPAASPSPAPTAGPSPAPTACPRRAPTASPSPAPTDRASTATASSASTSVHWREQGNSLYTSVTQGTGTSIGKDKFKQAIQCYQRAFDTGKTEEELASAAKNLGMSSWRLIKLTSGGGCDNSFLDKYMVLYQCKEAFKYFSYAYQHGRRVKSPDWVSGVLTSTRACWEDVSSNYVEDLDFDARAQALYDLSQAMEIDSIKATCYLKLTECQFHRGIMALQNADYKKCLNAMRECYRPLNEAARLTDEESTKAEVRVMETDVLMHQCMAESIQARAIGDSLFEKVLMEEENLNIDMVWEVIDWYKQATLRTREITEVELEAIAVSRIGRVYDKVLKLKYRAKEYYKHAIQLAASMHPRTFNLEDWYKECSQTLAKYQSETISAEEEKKNLEKMEIKKELKTEMKQLEDNKEKGHEDFLKYVYKTFPPKNKKHKLVLPKTFDHVKVKKALQKAVVHYHLDSVDVETHGRKWKVLSEEITKLLTSKYENMK